MRIRLTFTMVTNAAALAAVTDGPNGMGWEKVGHADKPLREDSPYLIIGFVSLH